MKAVRYASASGSGQVRSKVTAPQPWPRLAIEINERQGLGVVNDDDVVVEVDTDRVFVYHLLVDAPFQVAQVDGRRRRAGLR